MGPVELGALLADIRKVRIAVVGDFCLDAYWHLDPALSEPSIETGLPTRAVRAQRYSLGGAGNVAANLAAMGVGSVRAFGALGDDPFGREMIRILSSVGIDGAGMQVQRADWMTPVYVKPVEAEREQNRIDFGNANRLAPETGARLLDALRRALPETDLVVVNQQLPHGIHTEWLREELAGLIGEATRGNRTVPFISDSRSFSDSYRGAMRKLNDREALRLAGVRWDSEEPVPLEEARRAVVGLAGRWGTTVFMTRGARGIMVCAGAGVEVVPGLQILGRIDTVGAGDSALAGIAAAVAAGRAPRAAAELGNFAAGVTVQKLFTTGTASPEEILAIGSDPDYVCSPELAADPRRARLHGDTEIEVVGDRPRPTAVTHAIFDNDGTVSTLREGWEGIMEPVMVRAILGPGWKTADDRLYRSVEERVRDYIDRTTGVQTIVQMHGLVELVREFAVVPAAEVLEPEGYKAIYNEELLAVVGRRVGKLRRGELAVGDCVLAGSLPFVAAMAKAGVKLYLASGTDQPDVVAEAEALGYAGLFSGGIFGSVGDVRRDAKQVVLERILAEIGASSVSALVTFGDGPVEIRETRKRGGYCVGVASDEVRRFGLNARKRERLVKAGADLVVADFTQWRSLLGYLGVPA